MIDIFLVLYNRFLLERSKVMSRKCLSYIAEGHALLAPYQELRSSCRRRCRLKPVRQDEVRQISELPLKLEVRAVS